MPRWSPLPLRYFVPDAGGGRSRRARNPMRCTARPDPTRVRTQVLAEGIETTPRQAPPGCLAEPSASWSIRTTFHFQLLDAHHAGRVYIFFAAASSTNPFRGGIIRRVRFGRRCSETLGCGPRDFECLSRFNHPARLTVSGVVLYREPYAPAETPPRETPEWRWGRSGSAYTRSTNPPVRVSIFTWSPTST